MEEARDLFRNQKTTEFVIVSIPTVMAMAESERLAAALKQEDVPVKVGCICMCFCFLLGVSQAWHVRVCILYVRSISSCIVLATQMILVNQVVQEGATSAFLSNRRKDQQRALQRLRDDPELRYDMCLSSLCMYCDHL